MEKANKKYDFDQCALYKCKSKKKLAELLLIDLRYIKNSKNFIDYHSFKLTGKNNKTRLINAPQPILKKIQKRLLALLRPINRPAWVMFGEKGKSYIQNAIVHQYNPYCITMDVKGFYDHCHRDAVYRFCKNKLQVSPDVATIITDFTTWEQRIPTGSPVSQILAYHAYEDMFYRINAYVASIEGVFTLYVDDMTISSKNPIDPKKIASNVGKILRSYGHVLSPKKTKYYSPKDFKKITGVAISPNQQLMVSNSLSLKIRQELASIRCADNDNAFVQGTARLSGLLQAARAIRPDYMSNL